MESQTPPKNLTLTAMEKLIYSTLALWRIIGQVNVMKKVLLLLILSLFFLPSPSKAAGIFFGVQSKDVGINKDFEVGVFINTQNQSVNAVEGEIKFPSNYFALQGFYNGGSMLTFWIKQPTLTSDGTVSFTGLT